MHLRCAGQGTGREGGAQHVHRGHAILQRALDIADDVHHMAVALHAEGLSYLDAAGFGNTADVVARQVDQHHMLGALLRVVDEFGLSRPVLGQTGAARPGAGQRPDGDFLLSLVAGQHGFLAHQDLGTSAHHMEITQVVVIHIGAGVERAQRPVQAQGRLGVALFQALADLHLHEVTTLDQALGPRDRRQVVGLGKFALHRVALTGFDQRRTDRVLELLLEFAQAPLGVGIGLGLRWVGVNNQVELA